MSKHPNAYALNSYNKEIKHVKKILKQSNDPCHNHHAHKQLEKLVHLKKMKHRGHQNHNDKKIKRKAMKQILKTRHEQNSDSDSDSCEQNIYYQPRNQKCCRKPKNCQCNSHADETSEESHPPCGCNKCNGNKCDRNKCSCNKCELVECTVCHLWDGYWPFIGRDCNESKNIELDAAYLDLTNNLVNKWSSNMLSQQPQGCNEPVCGESVCRESVCNEKDLFKLELNTSPCGSAITLSLSPDCATHPFQLNQFLVIKNKSIPPPTGPTTPTNILAIIAYYNSQDVLYNELTGGTDTSHSVKNLFFSTQLFFMHIKQIPDYVNLIVSNNASMGDNMFQVCIKTNCKIEIKEKKIAVSTPDSGPFQVNIFLRTIYINEKYFMTYAIYVDNVAGAISLGTPTFTTDLRQVPLQLGVMLLFAPTAPLVDLTTVTTTNDQQRELVKAFNFLQANP